MVASGSVIRAEGDAMLEFDLELQQKRDKPLCFREARCVLDCSVIMTGMRDISVVSLFKKNERDKKRHIDIRQCFIWSPLPSEGRRRLS